MEYTTGDTVKFRLKSGEIREGKILYIEKSFRGNILYINGLNRRAYIIPEERVISLDHEEEKFTKGRALPTFAI